VEISDAQDVMLAQLDGDQMHKEELVLDQFQSAHASKSTQPMDIHACLAQETLLFLEPITKFVFQFNVVETLS
jgi:hypothetical protein